MSGRAREFLIRWFSVNVHPLPAVRRLTEGVRLAARCREEAIAVGIVPQEIRDAVGGDLIRKILAALDAAARLDDVAARAEVKTLVD